MKILFTLLALCFALNAHAATYMLLSQTNAFAAGITNETKAYADTKAPLASPSLTGTPTINGQSVETQLTNKVAKAGDTMSGGLSISSTLSATNADLTLNEIRFRPTVPTGQGSWTFNSGTGATNNADGTYDEVSNWGFNYRPFGGRYDNSLHSLKFGLESNYKSSDLTNYSEWNIDFTTAAGVSSRPYGMTIANLTGLATWQWAGPYFYFAGQQAGDPNRTIWHVLTNADLSTFDFNGSISATKDASFLNTLSSRTNFVYNQVTALPFNTSSYERAFGRWNIAAGTVYEMGTEALGSGVQRGWALLIGTNRALEAFTAATELDTCAANLVMGTTSGGVDSQVSTLAGNLTLQANGTSKRVILNASSAGNSVDVGMGVLKVSRAASGTLAITSNGANGLIGPTTTTMTTLDIGMSANFQPGSLVRTTTDGTTYFLGTNGIVVLQLGRTNGVFGGTTKVLTSAAATDIFWVSVPNTNRIGGHVIYTVSATDGTESQEVTGDVKFGALAKGTTVTAGIKDDQITPIVSTGTLTAVIASNTATNNVYALGLTATTSLTTTNLVIRWRLETPSIYTVNPL